jgi:cyclopropane-fatty-acyl-phospholipid synthase
MSVSEKDRDLPEHGISSAQPDRSRPLGLRARLLHRLVEGVSVGQLRLVLPSGEVHDLGRAADGPDSAPDAVLVIHRWKMLWRCLGSGAIGFADGYIEQDWSTPDLVALIRFAARNTHALSRAIHGSKTWSVLNRWHHRLRGNSRRGSKRNIQKHYDLGNEFYKLWLDSSMMYSSALFEAGQNDLEAAQLLRLKRIETLLALAPGQSVLEIGCGWGALAAHLAREAGAEVQGITLSPAQLALAKARVDAAGLGEQVHFALQDYRDVAGGFDRIVSIEMIEAVGQDYLPTYFATIARCLKPGGHAVLQAITIEEDRFEDYLAHTDFIQKYIFPGGFLPTKTLLAELIHHAGLRLVSHEYFGESYARTLAEWRKRFHANWEKIAQQGFEPRFQRLWDYYLCYCEAGFWEGAIDVGFYVIAPAET